jgi:outer membrane protein OmpA-like peptidoglycan-associated protein
MKPIFRLIPAAVALFALAACQTTAPANADLSAARAAVERARSDPHAARSGALELDRAQQTLRRAQANWADDQDVAQTRHLSYLASQRAETALALGAQARYEERLQSAGAERERIRLEARTREAEAATRNAQSAQASAQTARIQADTARSEADRARELARQEAERASALERDLQSLQAKNTQRGLVVTLGDVLFATGSATLNQGSQRTLERLAEVLKQYPERRVLIEGYTDDVGSDASNLELSRRRAEAFREALLSRGIGSDRVEVRAHGEAMPVADNATATGRQQNRRVEILFSDMQGRFAAVR